MTMACLVVAGSQVDAMAVSFSAKSLSSSALSEMIGHPEGSYGAEGAVAGMGGFEYGWNLAGKYKSAMVVISTDHVMSASNIFSFDVAGFDESLSSWVSGVFTGKTYKVAGSSLDTDDYAMRFDFGSAVSKIAVSSGGTMALSDETGSGVTAEFDGVSPVPEPSTLMLIGSGLAGLAYFRRRTFI